MIKIIKGTYGHHIPTDENDPSKGGRTEPVTPDSEPISLSPEQEKRLVDRGVAEYVGTPPVTDPPPPNNPLAYNEDMKLEELKTIAINGYKCDPETINKMRAKKDVIAAIEQARAENEDDNEPPVNTGGEGQPNLNSAPPVQ